MCDYCGCRDVEPIYELSKEHERIRTSAGEIRRALALEDFESASRWLLLLQGQLRPHLEREEQGVFRRLARHEEIGHYLTVLAEDHATARAEILALQACSPQAVAALTRALDALDAHIDLEEYDLFPASRTLLDSDDWAEVATTHQAIPPFGELSVTASIVLPASQIT